MNENTKTSSPLEVAFYFDYQSPYSYFAAEQVKALCARYQAVLHWRPMVIGAVFQACNITAPAEQPHRRAYMLQDLMDLAEFYQRPYVPRETFIFNSILAMRATLVVAEEARGEVVVALFDAVFAKGQDLSQQQVLQDTLNAIGVDPVATLEKTTTPAVKAALRESTDDAIAQGVFGAPTTIFNGKRLWGQDRLPLLERLLKKAQPTQAQKQ